MKTIALIGVTLSSIGLIIGGFIISEFLPVLIGAIGLFLPFAKLRGTLLK